MSSVGNMDALAYMMAIEDGSFDIDHVWGKCLQRALLETASPSSLEDALRPLTSYFPEINDGDLQAAVDGQRMIWRTELYDPAGDFKLPKSYLVDWAVLRDSLLLLDRDTRRGPRTRLLAVITRRSAHRSLLRTHKPGSPLLPCLGLTPMPLARPSTHCSTAQIRPPKVHELVPNISRSGPRNVTSDTHPATFSFGGCLGFAW